MKIFNNGSGCGDTLAYCNSGDGDYEYERCYYYNDTGYGCWFYKDGCGYLYGKPDGNDDLLDTHPNYIFILDK